MLTWDIGLKPQIGRTNTNINPIYLNLNLNPKNTQYVGIYWSALAEHGN